MDWIVENKEWAFSGIGVFILGLIYAYFKKDKKDKKINMKQKSGSHSKNIQVGGDYKAK